MGIVPWICSFARVKKKTVVFLTDSLLQNPGQLKIYSGGISWKKQGGGKAIEVDKADIVGVTWMKVPRTNQLGVRIKDGLYYKFTGFRDLVSIPSSLVLTKL